VHTAATSVFVGREAELGVLHDAFVEASAGQLRVLVVEGEGGIGKTTLVDRFLAELPAPRVLRAAIRRRLARGQSALAGGAPYSSSVTCRPQLTGLSDSSFCCMATWTMKRLDAQGGGSGGLAADHGRKSTLIASRWSMA
jgi:hypothetical protein